MTKKKSNEKLIELLVYAALEILRKSEGRKMLLSELREKLAASNGDLISDDLKVRDRWNQIKWHHRLASTAHSFVEAGYMTKLGGEWQLTSKGADAMSSLGREGMIKTAREENLAAQKRRKMQNSAQQPGTHNASDDANSSGDDRLDIEGHQSDAKNEIKAYIQKMDPYHFQELCAALLNGMGYHICHISPPGPDGGVDIDAYADPLGAGRVKVQAKRYNDSTKVSVAEVRELAGALDDGDIGVFITSSRYAKGCDNQARKSRYHIKLIDFGGFIDLWFKHYENLPKKDKQLLPLQPIYFLAKD